MCCIWFRQGSADTSLDQVLRLLMLVGRDCKARFVFVLNVIFSKAPRLGLVMAWATSTDPYNNPKPWDEMEPYEKCLQE